MTQGDSCLNIIGISELFRIPNINNYTLPGYHALVSRSRTDDSRGGVGLYIKQNISYTILEDITVFIPHVFESLFVEITDNKQSYVVGVVYRPNTPPLADARRSAEIMSELMAKINTRKRKCVIMGDFNVDLLKHHESKFIEEYLNDIISNGFLPVITKPTRVTQTTATLIDHIYTNDVSSDLKSGIIVTDVADHFGTYISLQHDRTSDKSNDPQTYRSFTNENMSTFIYLLRQVDFSVIESINDANSAYDTFLQLYLEAYEQAFPLKIIKSSSNSHKREPWVTSGLLTSSRHKSRLYRKQASYPTTENINKYKKYNSIFNKLKRVLKKMHFNRILELARSDIKKTWSILNSVVGKKSDVKKFPSFFKINGVPVSDKNTIANELNTYFSSIGKHISSSVPPSAKPYNDYLPPHHPVVFY